MSQERERRRKERIEEDRELCRDFSTFVKRAWHVLEPETPYVHCWHVDVIGEHAKAIHDGEITRLQINQPPGTMKSTAATVLMQAWEWGPMQKQGLRYLTTSYKEGYARRDSRKTLSVVTSEWFQERWPMKMLRENETDFENVYRGNRSAVSIASLTAGRGNRLIIDDPHSTETVESETERETATRIFRESATSRLNDPAKDAIIVIMHRLHVKDICGVIEELELPYVKLKLPMEYEPENTATTKWFRDPRTEPGELLCPQRVPLVVLDAAKKQLTTHAYAGQYQQRPAAREGGMFKRHWFKIVDAVPSGHTKRVRKWDLAGTQSAAGNDPSWTCGLKMAKIGDEFYIEDVQRDRVSSRQMRNMIKNTASQDGKPVKIVIPQDPGQAGKDQSQSIIAENAGYNIRAERETGDKMTRAEPFEAQCEAGNVYLLRGPWNDAFIDELCSFPAGHDDQVDAASGAFNSLAAGPKPLVFTKEALMRSAMMRTVDY